MRKLLMTILCLALTGCRMITFSVDGLLNAPNVADEQSAIYSALIESAGRGITLEYPRSGDYRSAFVLNDIDGDGEDEALAFYSVSAVADSNVKISVLNREADGVWHSRYELAGGGSSVDRIMFLGGDVVVGYSSLEYEENTLEMYRFSNERASENVGPIYSCSYTILDKADLDGCGKQELTVIRKSGAGLEFLTLKSRDDTYDVYSLSIDIGTSTVSGYNFGSFGSGKAMYIDAAFESGGLATEIISLGADGIICPTLEGFGGAAPDVQTIRPSGYSSRDYDGDGRVEIPVVEAFMGYTSGGEGIEYMTHWLSYDEETGGFIQKSNAYYNLRDGYVLTIPNRWLNVVTVHRDFGTGEVTFSRYDAAGGSKTAPVMSFASADSSGGGAYVSSGYSVLLETDLTTYYVKAAADPNEPLVLTMDEIRDNFHVIE